MYKHRSKRSGRPGSGSSDQRSSSQASSITPEEESSGQSKKLIPNSPPLPQSSRKKLDILHSQKNAEVQKSSADNSKPLTSIKELASTSQKPPLPTPTTVSKSNNTGNLNNSFPLAASSAVETVSNVTMEKLEKTANKSHPEPEQHGQSQNVTPEEGDIAKGTATNATQFTENAKEIPLLGNLELDIDTNVKERTITKETEKKPKGKKQKHAKAQQQPPPPPPPPLPPPPVPHPSSSTTSISASSSSTHPVVESAKKSEGGLSSESNSTNGQFKQKAAKMMPFSTDKKEAKSQLLKGLLYEDPSKYNAQKSETTHSQFTASELLNMRRKLKKVDRQDNFNPGLYYVC